MQTKSATYLLRALLLVTVVALASNVARAQATDAAAGDALERNKKNVLAFYDLATNQSKPREAVERYVGESYTQHNPEVADGKEGFIAYFEKQAKTFPGKKFEFKRLVAEGNFVVVHTRSVFPESWVHTDWAGIDIFRLDERGKIVEHWDVLQPIPTRVANKNGMF